MDPLFGPKCNVIKHISQSTIASHRLDKMEIQIQTLSGNFNVSIGHSDTILDLKKKIEEAEGMEPELQTLSLMGYIIDDDNVPVSELTQLGGNTFSLLLPKAGAPRRITSDRQLYIVTGNRNDFSTLLIHENETKAYKLRSKRFGIIYEDGSGGSEHGTRVFNVEVFKMTEKGNIEIKTKDKGNTFSYEVFLLDEKNPNGPGKLLTGVNDTYDENKQKDVWSKAGKIAKILGNAGTFGTFLCAVAELIFGAN